MCKTEGCTPSTSSSARLYCCHSHWNSWIVTSEKSIFFILQKNDLEQSVRGESASNVATALKKCMSVSIFDFFFEMFSSLGRTRTACRSKIVGCGGRIFLFFGAVQKILKIYAIFGEFFFLKNVDGAAMSTPKNYENKRTLQTVSLSIIGIASYI